MLLHLGRVDGDQPRRLAGGPALEPALAHALVRRASRGALGEVLRLHRPASPVVVFGRRDTRLPGFDAAVRAAELAGFAVAVRATGGRAVAYTPQAIVVDHVMPDPDAVAGLEDRFERFGALLAGAVAALGVDARVGAVPGEYCPGAHSVNARGTVKLVGTAQRAVKGAWLFSALVVVGDEARLRPVLDEMYRHLGLPFDPASVGSLSGERPELSVEDVQGALLTAYGVGDLAPQPVDPATLALAADLVDQHRVTR